MRTRIPLRLLALSAASVFFACGPSTANSTTHGKGSGSDAGGGGGNDAGNPNLPCVDNDNDGFTTCQGDCNDNDPTIHPGATEVLNGKDDDCDGRIDNHIPGRDWDGDGANYPMNPGFKNDPSLIQPGEDCDDDNPLIGPNGINIPGDPTVYDCGVGTPVGACDTALPNGQSSAATDMAKAIGLCDPRFTVSATVSGAAAGRSLRSAFGTSFVPKEGAKFIHLSSGQSKDNLDDPNYTPHDVGGNSNILDSNKTKMSNPDWSAPPCGPSAGSTQAVDAFDQTQLQLTLKVPQNAINFSFQFAFFSAEYAFYVCDQYDDRFIADLKSRQFNGNVSFDSQHNPVTVNNAFLSICHSEPTQGGIGPVHHCTTEVTKDNPGVLAKTGYDLADGEYLDPQGMVGGSTGWLTTTSPVTPGETITLTFYVFDEGDSVLDSSVLIDNFQWGTQAVGGPITAQ